MRQELEKQDIVIQISKEANIPIKEVEYVVSRTFEIIAEEMKKGNTVNIAKFGKFEPKRVIRNNVKVLGKMTTNLDYIELVFRPHQTLKDYVNDRKKKKKETV
jgi:nucleoid DNA-binding protein